MHKFLFAVTLGLTSLSGTASNFTFSVQPGPHAVGLRVVHQYDYSRAYRGPFDIVTGEPTRGERARPIQTLVWYPAQGSGKPMTYGEYLLLVGTEERFDKTPEEISRAARESTGLGGMTPAQVEHEWKLPMRAVRDAKPLAGAYPVVIYAPSLSAPAYENADLCEYLASQGYLVLASPDMGPHGRGMTADLEGIEAQVGDIEFLIGYARSLPQADVSRTAVIGFSWGGISNVFAAARDSRITALVCLDGSVRYFPKLVKDSGYVTPGRVAIPLLFLAQQPLEIEELIDYKLDVSESFLRRMTFSDVYRVTMNEMSHRDFSSLMIRFAAPERFKEFSAAEVSQAYGWMVRYVHQFLNAYAKSDPSGKAFLQDPPSNHGVPSRMLSVEARPAAGGWPPTRGALAAEISRRGFEHSLDVYNEARKKDGSFLLSEIAVNSWGYDLLGRAMTKEAIEIFKMNVTLYPDAFNTYDSLGEAYERAGDKENAIKNYRRSVELNPKNDNAVIRLQKLDPDAPGNRK